MHGDLRKPMKERSGKVVDFISPLVVVAVVYLFGDRDRGRDRYCSHSFLRSLRRLPPNLRNIEHNPLQDIIGISREHPRDTDELLTSKVHGIVKAVDANVTRGFEGWAITCKILAVASSLETAERPEPFGDAGEVDILVLESDLWDDEDGRPRDNRPRRPSEE